MPDRLTAALAADLCRPHLAAGETLLSVGHGIEQAWWTHLVRLGNLLARHYVVAATEERLLLVEHGITFAERSFTALAWRDLERVELGRGLLLPQLTLASATGTRRIGMPRYSPLPGNLEAGRAVVALWSERRAPRPARSATG